MSEKTLRLIVGGKNYTGWQSTSLQRTIESVAGSFSLSLTDIIRGSKLPLIKRNDPAKIEIQPTPQAKVIKLLDGFVDKVTINVDKKVQFGISGRDRTADIVDSSIIDRSEFKGLKFEQAVQTIVNPFKIKVVLQTGLDTGDVLKNIANDPGIKIYELIAKYAQLKQLLCYTLPDGRLIISRVATETTKAAFIEGGKEGNILRYSHTTDGTKMFSEYTVKGSHAVTIQETEAQAAHVEGKAEDKRIPRLRQLLIIPDTAQNKTTAVDRAIWEMQTRRAQGESYSVTIKGWQPILNVIAFLKLPSLEFEGNMLISAYNLKFDKLGKSTIFKFVHPDSFRQLPTSTITKDKKDSKLNQ